MTSLIFQDAPYFGSTPRSCSRLELQPQLTGITMLLQYLIVILCVCHFLGVSCAMHAHLPSYPGSYQLCNIAREKTREPGKTYHVSDVAGGTDLNWIKQVGSTRHVTRVIRFTWLPCFSRVTLKSWEEPGYEASTHPLCSVVPNNSVVNLKASVLRWEVKQHPILCITSSVPWKGLCTRL